MIQRNQFQKGFGFGLGVIIIVSFLPYYSPLKTPREVLFIAGIAIFAGIISGYLFSWLLNRFINSNAFINATRIKLNADEQIIFESPANHFKRFEGTGGKLYLTNKRLIFKSHNLNLNNHQLIIPLLNIIKAYKYKSMGITSNRISVLTTEQKIEKFIVDKKEGWPDLIMKIKNQLPETILRHSGVEKAGRESGYLFQPPNLAS